MSHENTRSRLEIRSNELLYQVRKDKSAGIIIMSEGGGRRSMRLGVARTNARRSGRSSLSGLLRPSARRSSTPLSSYSLPLVKRLFRFESPTERTRAPNGDHDDGRQRQDVDDRQGDQEWVEIGVEASVFRRSEGRAGRLPPVVGRAKAAAAAAAPFWYLLRATAADPERSAPGYFGRPVSSPSS